MIPVGDANLGKNIHELIDKILVINLAHRIDRRSHMEDQIKAFPMQLQSSIEFLPASNGNLMKPPYPVQVAADFQDPRQLRYMTHGEMGCLLSHVRVWEMMVEQGLNTVMVLDADILLPTDDARGAA